MSLIRGKMVLWTGSRYRKSRIVFTTMFLQLIILLHQSTVGEGSEMNFNGKVHKRYERLLDEQKIIKKFLEGGPESYDWRVRPRGTLDPNVEDSPVDVTVNMYLRSISKVDDVNMEYSIQFTFREEWVDERLLFYSDTLPYVVLSPGQKIWFPDTVFQNEKDGKRHDIDQPNMLIRVYNGTARILYSCRLTLTLNCPMALNNYPLDIQTCFIEYSSYGYTTSDIVYHWKKGYPIQIKAGLYKSLPSFVLNKVIAGNCTSVTNTGAYSCLKAIIELKRQFSYYLFQLYIPSFMLVVVSWISFWMDKDAIPARVTVGMITLLMMTTQASMVNQNLPSVSYMKAIDIWIGVCLVFIFGAFLEFALVNWAARKDIIRQSHRHQHQAQFVMESNLISPHAKHDEYGTETANSLILNNAADTRVINADIILPRTNTWWGTLWNIRYCERSRRIDLMSRILFPVCFMIFNITYWTKYLEPYMAV